MQDRIAGAQQRQLPALLQQARQRLQHQIQPFLAGQAAHHGEQRRFVIHLQPHGDLQLPFILGFLFQAITVIARRQQQIALRIPDTIIDAVKDAGQAALVLALTQQPFHAVGILRFGDFPRVGWTHRRDMVGIVQPGFEERDLAVKFEAVHVIERPRQLYLIHMPGVKHSLVGEIVHRKHRFRRTPARRQIGRRQARVPVMGMYHLRAPEWIQSAGHFATHPAEQRKAQHVIGIGVHVGVVIRAPWAIVEMRRVDQIDTDAVKMAEQQGDAPGKGIPAGDDLRVGNPAADIRIPRQQHAGIHAVCDLRRRQRADNVSQTAGF